MEKNKKALRKPAGYWTKDRVFKESRKYQTRGEFQKSCLGAYKVALKNAWLNEMDWLKEAQKPSGYWTKEKVFEESKKYQSRSAFSMGCSVAYNIARQKHWLDEMVWLVKPYTVLNRKWAKENVFEESRKYQTRGEFNNSSSGAYKVALKNAWLDEMDWLAIPNVWTKERVFEEAQKYGSRGEFCKSCRSAYNVALKNAWLDEMVWLIDGRLKMFTDKIDCVYRYFFTETNSIYVGRTVNVKRRNDEHRTKKKDVVFRYANENGFEIPQMEIIEDKLTLEEGQEREDCWKEYYVRNGYNVLNKAKTGKGVGSLGAINCGKWTKDRVFEESRKYQTRGEFQKSCCSAYRVALKKAWLDEMDWLKETRKPNGYWTKDMVFEEAQKYDSRIAFSIGCGVAYNIACKNKWLDEMIWFNEQRKPNGYWTKEKVFDESRKYQTKSEFSKGSNRAYEVARKNGWLDEMVWLKEVRKPNGYWTKEKVFEESRKYQTNSEFCKGSSRAYEVARKNGWLDELFPKKK